MVLSVPYVAFRRVLHLILLLFRSMEFTGQYFGQPTDGSLPLRPTVAKG